MEPSVAYRSPADSARAADPSQRPPAGAGPPSEHAAAPPGPAPPGSVPAAPARAGVTTRPGRRPHPAPEILTVFVCICSPRGIRSEVTSPGTELTMIIQKLHSMGLRSEHAY